MWQKSLGKLSFIGKKEIAAKELILNEVKAASETVRSLEGVVAALSTGDLTLLKAESEKVSCKEESVDEIHRKGMMIISEGAFFAGIREDLLNLMEGIDDIADYSKDASRVISQYLINPVEYKVTFSAEEPIALVKKGEEAMSVLEQCVSQLFSNPKESVRLAVDVERKEHEGDEIKERLLEEIFERKDSLDVLALLELKDFILWLDNVIDAIEHASDVAIVIAAKSGVRIDAFDLIWL